MEQINKQIEEEFLTLGEMLKELIEKYGTGFGTSITCFGQNHVSISFGDSTGFFKYDNHIIRNYVK